MEVKSTGRARLRIDVGRRLLARTVAAALATALLTLARAPHAGAQEPTEVPRAGAEAGDCVADPRSDSTTARVWEDIRSALEGERLARREGRVPQRVRRYHRVLDGRLTVVSEEAATETTDARAPFRSVSADELAEEGFVRKDPTAWLYRAPDSDVLLSEPFRRTHCFGIDSRSGDGRVGLTFRPVAGRGVPDIEGTMWVDTATAELQTVDFHYTDVGLPVADSAARGRLAFDRVPAGEWFVRRWWIRWPRRVRETGPGDSERRLERFGVRPAESTREVVLYGEVGAEVRAIGTGGGAADAAGPRAAVGRGTITGLAYDSLRGAPAEGVEVRLRGTDRTATAAADGSFAFHDVPEGRYRVEFTHPFLPSLPDSLTAAISEIGPDDLAAEVRLASPGPERVRSWACGDETGALVLGRVLAKDGSGPVPDAHVWFDWRRDETESDALTAAIGSMHQGTMVADRTGRFLACGVPENRVVTVEARGSLDSLRIGPERPVAVLDVRVDLGAAIELTGREASVGPAGLIGTVVASDTDQPLPGTRLELIDADRIVATERKGRFRVTDLAPGLHRIVVEHLGYRTDTVQIDLPPETFSFVRLRAVTDPVDLAGLEVTVDRRVRHRELAGYYRRLDSGLGRFATREQIQRMGVLGAVRILPNVQVRPCYQNRIPIAGCYRLLSADRGHGFGVRSSSGRVIECTPDIYLDGLRLGRGGESAVGSAFEVIRNMPPEIIEGIEVHGPGTAPARYGGGAGCGVMLVWTSR